MNLVIYGFLSLIMGTLLMFSGAPGDALGVLLFIGGTVLIIQGKKQKRKK